MRKKCRPNAQLLLFCAPALLVYLVFKLFPAALGMFYALTNWNGLNKFYHVVGLANFVEIVSDRNFWNSVMFTCRYVLVFLVVTNLMALLLAVAIERLKKARGLFRTIFYMPNMISMIIAGFMWMFIFTKVIYHVADSWGWQFLNQSWIGNPRYSFVAIITVSAWGSTGYLMIIYMAALQGVSANLKEAAFIDGASPLQVFYRIILPLIRPAFTICVFWTLSSGFQVFDVIYALTGGGPGRATQSVAINIYEEAFKGNIRYGYATAKSMVLFTIVLVVTALQVRLSSRKEISL
jgi:raffinose/stachyose/melibiose transport system permease protein